MGKPGRGRKVNLEIRVQILSLFNEFLKLGYRRFKICEVIGVSQKMIRNWQLTRKDLRCGPTTSPSNKLTPLENKTVIEIATLPEFCDMSPKQIVPTLADRRQYILNQPSIGF